MIAKLAGPAPTRTAAEQARAKAAGETQVWPVKTNAGFLARAARHPDFVEGNIDTGFIERHADQLIPRAEPAEAVLSAAAAAILAPGTGPWGGVSGFRLNAPAARRASVEGGGSVYLDEEAGKSEGGRVGNKGVRKCKSR